MRPVVRLRGMLQEQIGEIEDQPAGAAIADRDPLRAPKPVEHREADAVERHAEAFRRLPRMAVGDQQVAAGGRLLQIVEIADDDATAPAPGTALARPQV